MGRNSQSLGLDVQVRRLQNIVGSLGVKQAKLLVEQYPPAVIKLAYRTLGRCKTCKRILDPPREKTHCINCLTYGPIKDNDDPVLNSIVKQEREEQIAAVRYLEACKQARE